jgi:hypothetical protein
MSQVLELAKQGDAKAIAALINRSLNPQGINTKVMGQGNTLKVLLESLDTPDQNRFQSYILQGLKKIGLDPAITQLEIYGKQGGAEGYAWTAAFEISGDSFTPIATPQAAAPKAPTATAVPATPNIPAESGNPFANDAGDNTAADSPVVKSDVSGLDQAEIVKRAKQGDLGAIAAFVKSALAEKEGLESFVELNGNVLKVTIETKQFLDGPAFCGEIGTKLNEIASPMIREVEFYKRKSEKTAPFMMKKAVIFHEQASPNTEPPSRQITSSTSNTGSSTAGLRPNGQSSAMSGLAGNAAVDAAPREKAKIEPARVLGAIVVLIFLIVFLAIQVPRMVSRMGVVGYFALVIAIVPAFKFYRFWKPMIDYVITGK